MEITSINIDGTVYDLKSGAKGDSIVGPVGPKGDTGPAGPAGPNGGITVSDFEAYLIAHSIQ